MATFQERLMDMDRRLGEMQAELDGQNRIDRAAPAQLLPASAGAHHDSRAALSRRLLSAMRDLLDGYEQVLAPATSSDGRHPEGGALRQFASALSRLPGVRDVALRESESADRSIIEVRLS